MLLDLTNDCAAHDNPVCGTSYFRSLVGTGYSESDDYRDSRMLLDPCDILRDALREALLGAGDAFPGDIVDETLAGRREHGDCRFRP